ncbi:MAG: protein kinase, partial [Gemmatimonadales bacterium]
MSQRIEDLKAALRGRYEIDREIGQGGMANVYLADDVKHHRQVAVKVLRPDLAAALGPDRFLREIEIAANLMHPHILPLYDSGEADGFLYYVMPYVKGETLRQRVEKEGELPVSEAVRIVREVVDALAFAHSQGVVHRDIKPDNVMLSGRHAMVTDFGVAKAISEATGRNQLTTAGVALGTPAYMAPEQATADPHIDHRADIYALGALAYELLTGRPPFTAGTPQAVLAAHVTEQVEPVRKHRDQVPAALEAIVMRCLAKKPADRWQTADEMLPQLEALATTSGGMTPAMTRPLTAFYTAPRNPLKVALSVAGVVLLGWLATRLIGGNQLTVTVLSNRQITRAPGLEIDPAISPDGREVAYVAGPLGETKVFLQDTEGRNPLPLSADIEGSHRGALWTPDGRRIVFTQELGTQNRVVTVSRTGGQPETFTSGRTALLAISPDNEWLVRSG